MKKVKEILEREGKLEDVKNSLINMLNAALEIVEEVAPEGSGEILYKKIENYMTIMRVAKDYLPEEQIRKISERFNQLTRIWVNPYQSVAEVSRSK